MADIATSLPFAVFGIDHHRTPVQMRERLALSGDALTAFLLELTRQPGVGEAVVLSTCNRTEFYLAGAPDRPHLVALLAERAGVMADTLGTHGYWHLGDQCVRHLFRVVSSLESLVIGENQIAHQVKTAYEQALAAQCTGAFLNPLFQRALAVGKDVRTTTDIGKHKLSIASVAVDLARHIHGDLGGARLLVIGAGEMAELAVKHLVGAGVRTLTIVNRSEERALEIAGASADVRPWGELGDALANADIVVASTAAPHLVVTAAEVKRAMRGRRQPLMLMDLAVPRDVDDQAAQLDDVYLYNIDHLEAAVAANRALRQDEVHAASALVDTLAGDFTATQAHHNAPLLARVAVYFNDIVAAEEARLTAKLGATHAKEMRYGLERIGNKLQHRVLAYLREHAGDAQSEAVVRKMLGLE